MFSEDSITQSVRRPCDIARISLTSMITSHNQTDHCNRHIPIMVIKMSLYQTHTGVTPCTCSFMCHVYIPRVLEIISCKLKTLIVVMLVTLTNTRCCQMNNRNWRIMSVKGNNYVCIHVVAVSSGPLLRDQ